MRPEREPSRELPRPLPDPDAEQEIDVGRLGRALARRWWLIIAAVAVGAVGGYFASVGAGDVFQAKTTVYLGQPLSPSGNLPLPSLATNPATVNQIVRDETVVRSVARELRLSPGRLRRGISTRSIADTTRRASTPNPLVEIGVRGPWRVETAQAANLLAAAVVKGVSGYVDVKISSLREQLTAQNRELASIERRLTALQTATAQAGGLSTVERLVLLNLVGLTEQRRGQLLDERTQTRQLITLADTVERSSVVTKATAVKVPAKSRRSSMLVGGLIGLLAGCALALVWEAARGRARAPA